jgi:hypothetical protein
LRARLEAIAQRELGGQDLVPTLRIDAVVQLSDLDWAMLALLSELEPHGEQNPQPIFISSGLEIKDVHGGAGEPTPKLVVRDPGASGPSAPSGTPSASISDTGPRNCPSVDLAYAFEAKRSSAATNAQLNMDLRPAGGLAR